MLNDLITKLSQFMASLDWSSGSKDLIILLVFVMSLIVHIFGLKKDKFFALLFGIEAAYVVVLFFPYHYWLASLTLDQLTWAKVFGFVFLSFFLAGIFIRAHIFSSVSSGIISRFLQASALGILNTGVLLTLLATLLPLEIVSTFSKVAQDILNTEFSRFIWLAVPLVVFIMSVKIKRRGPGRPSLE